MRAQTVREHLLDGSLAVGADDDDGRDAEPIAPVLREASEREPRVADHDERQARRRDPADSFDHRRGRAALARSTDVVVTVEALAAQRHKERTRLDRAAVGRHRRESRVGPDHVCTQRGGGFGELHHPAHPASASRASWASENGTRRPAIS